MVTINCQPRRVKLLIENTVRFEERTEKAGVGGSSPWPLRFQGGQPGDTRSHSRGKRLRWRDSLPLVAVPQRSHLLIARSCDLGTSYSSPEGADTSTLFLANTPILIHGNLQTRLIDAGHTIDFAVAILWPEPPQITTNPQHFQEF